MRYSPGTNYGDCETHNFGGPIWEKRNGRMKYIRLIPFIWRLLKILLRYGNAEVFYHICGNGSAYDVPMNAENVEVRLTNCGPKVTIW